MVCKREIPLHPFKVLLPGADLEMALDDAEVDPAVADHREERPCRDLRDPAVVPESQILDIELLLVDGRRGQQRRLDAPVEPLRGEVARVADLPGRFRLAGLALRLAVAQRLCSHARARQIVHSQDTGSPCRWMWSSNATLRGQF